MKIQGLAKLTLLDYPGLVACTVFTGGCNFRCPFCHNASLVLSPADGDEIDEDEFFRFLSRRKGVLDGVCVTGGEPLLQKDLPQFMARIRELGFKVKLDTNGALTERLDEILSANLADYVAMDVKNSPALYGKTAGADINLQNIEKSIALIMEKAPDYEFRTTVVSGFHTPQSIRGAAEMIKGAKKYFLQGFVDSGALIRPGLAACTKEQMLEMLAEARAVIPGTALRGVDA